MNTPELNFQNHIQKNIYPGRGLALGCSSTSELIQLYWIMGRSDNSRNRVFEVSENGTMRTKAADPTKVQDPSLVIYEAMLEKGHHYIVSNGDQTRTIYQMLLRDDSTGFEAASFSRDREPDQPNFTPRISGMISLEQGRPFFRFSILKANAAHSERSDRNFYYKECISEGTGYLLTTYMGDGSPLPSFTGEPLPIPLEGTSEEIANTYWDALHPENKISLAVKSIAPQTGESHIHVINRY